YVADRRKLFPNLYFFDPDSRIFGPNTLRTPMTNTSHAHEPIDRAQLASAIADASLLRGEFTLRSGRKSSYYLDKYRFSTQPTILRQLGPMFAQIVEQVSEDHGRVVRLAGAELGGIPLVTVASLETGLPSIFVRNAKKDYGTAKQVEGTVNEGDVVVFVEDVATTGGQALEAVEVLRSLGARVPAIISVIDRQEGARENIEGAGVAFHALFTRKDLGVEDE
ncbi:MAG: orotate phosphoribosyltransferase, partial [bacterium]|nr:orotate phosphoribosyltransferase [bacterium]